MTAPTYVGSVQVSNWATTGSNTTASLAVEAGDLLVFCGLGVDDSGQSLSVSNSGDALTWTAQETLLSETYGTALTLWTATADASRSLTVTVTESKGHSCGGWLSAWREAAIGATASGYGSSGPTLLMTTTSADASCLYFDGDRNAQTASPAVFRTTGLGTATTVVEYDPGSVQYSAFGCYYATPGTVEQKTFGMTAPTAQAASQVAMEVLYEASGPAPTTVAGSAAVPAFSERNVLIAIGGESKQGVW